jgi:hypothetical protein
MVKMLGAILQNLVPRATTPLGFVYLCPNTQYARNWLCSEPAYILKFRFNIVVTFTCRSTKSCFLICRLKFCVDL